MRNLVKSILIASMAITLLSACKKNKSNDPSPTTPIEVGGGDEENITRVVLRFVNESDTIYATFKDPTGKGTNLVIDTIKLNPSKTYNAIVKVYDDTKNPVAVVSDEIQEEANFHRFHYTFTPLSGTPSLASIITDQDSKTPSQPLGLRFNLQTGVNVGTGIFKVSLRHFAGGVEKTSDPAGGDSDILVEFPVRVK